MSSGFKRFGLEINPFSPAVAEERPPKLLLIVGREYNKIRDFVYSRYKDAIDKKVLNFVVLKGVRGSGKSAIIMDFKNRINGEASIAYFRLDRESSFRIAMALFIKRIINRGSLKKVFREDKIVNEVLNREVTEIEYDLQVLIDKVISILSHLKNKPLVIIWDQLENLVLEEGEDRVFLNFVRNVSISLPRSIDNGVLFIIAITPERYGEIVKILGSEMAFIRNLEAGTVEMPSRMEVSDTIELFRKLIGIVRTSDIDLLEKIKDNPYYPFTEDAVKSIYDLADGVPGAIYELASRVLDEAISYPDVEVIDERFVHDVILEISPEWYKALTLPQKTINEILDQLLESAKELNIIRDYQRLVGNLEKYRHLQESFSILRGFSENKITEQEYNDIVRKRVLDYIVIYEKEGGFYVTLIRTARITVRGDTARAISSLLNRLTGFKYGGAIISKERIRYILLTYGRVSGSARALIEQASITSGVRVDIVEINTSSPYIYGRVRSLHERMIRLKRVYSRLRAIPSKSKITLVNDIVDALSILGIVP